MCEAICTVSASGAIGRTYNLGRVHRDADLVLATHFVRTSLLSDLLEGEEALARGRLGVFNHRCKVLQAERERVKVYCEASAACGGAARTTIRTSEHGVELAQAVCAVLLDAIK